MQRTENKLNPKQTKQRKTERRVQRSLRNIESAIMKTGKGKTNIVLPILERQEGRACCGSTFASGGWGGSSAFSGVGGKAAGTGAGAGGGVPGGPENRPLKWPRFERNRRIYTSGAQSIMISTRVHHHGKMRTDYPKFRFELIYYAMRIVYSKPKEKI